MTPPTPTTPTPTPRTDAVNKFISKRMAVATNGSTVVSWEDYKDILYHISQLETELAAANAIIEREVKPKEKCVKCNQLWHPSLVESSWCIFCICDDWKEKATAALRDLAETKRHLALCRETKDRVAEERDKMEEERDMAKENHNAAFVKLWTWLCDHGYDKASSTVDYVIEILEQTLRERDYLNRQRNMMYSMLIENVTFTDEQLKEAGLGVGINIEIRHDLPLERKRNAALMKIAEELRAWAGSICRGEVSDTDYNELEKALTAFDQFKKGLNQ